MNQFFFKANINKSETVHPKGFYYQGKKHIVLVGCVVSGHTIRRKELVEDVELVPMFKTAP